MGTRSAWTLERRARQAQIIRCTQPWRQAKGPRTKKGKQASSRNARAFLGDAEMRRAYILVHQFLRSGKMTPELGRLFLAADLSAPAADTIYFDTYADDEGDDLFR